jgi:hypothetical protein
MIPCNHVACKSIGCVLMKMKLCLALLLCRLIYIPGRNGVKGKTALSDRTQTMFATEYPFENSLSSASKGYAYFEGIPQAWNFPVSLLGLTDTLLTTLAHITYISFLYVAILCTVRFCTALHATTVFSLAQWHRPSNRYNPTDKNKDYASNF